jgi:peptidoglycan/LPS O-acetylase OafA/YrhL
MMPFTMFVLSVSNTDIKFNRKLDLSYSTYLYHMLIVQILISLNITGSGYVYFIVIGVTFAIAYLSWTYIEKPMLRLKMKK